MPPQAPRTIAERGNRNASTIRGWSRRSGAVSFDPAGRLIGQETGTLAAWQSETVAPSAWTGLAVARTAETRYDLMSRKVREWTREGAAGPVRTMTEYGYDAQGRLECTAVRMDPAAFAFTGTPNACLASGAADRIARIVYDEAGRAVQQRVGTGAEEGAEATFAHNLNGQRTVVSDGNGNRAELRYDGNDRRTGGRSMQRYCFLRVSVFKSHSEFRRIRPLLEFQMQHLPLPKPPDSDKIAVAPRAPDRQTSIPRLMVEKGLVSLSIDRALWAIAGIVAAFRSPEVIQIMLDRLG
jgi:hypothetical protein